MKITIAENAGFCFGVKRATDYVEALISDTGGKARIYTLGKLIHNRIYNEQLSQRGVVEASVEDADRIAALSDTQGRAVMVIRTHGVAKEVEEKLRELSAAHENFEVVDLTCPYVKRIHKIAAENSGDNSLFIIIGCANHPEVEGIMSYVRDGGVVFADSASLEEFLSNEKDPERAVVMVAQTTQKLSEWKNCQRIIKKVYTNPFIFDTICNVTENRQLEVEELSKNSDVMIVIGGRDSSNTGKLYELCKKNCPHTQWIENADELKRDFNRQDLKIGIAAGASTPRSIIEEVFMVMSNDTLNENFEAMLEESFKTLNTGDTVRGIVTSISPNEIHVDLGTKVTGIITYDQITDDTSVKLEDMFKIGDEIDAFVIKVSDIEGTATLSKKRVDLIKNWQKIVDASVNGTTLTGKIVEVVKGGVLILINGVKVFVPASQSGLPREADLSTLLGTTQNVKITEINEQRRHAYASIRAVVREERKANEETFWANVQEGKHYRGKVKSMTTYGAFVDIGGVDGMVHNSELSWKRIKHPSEIVSIGDEIDVYVKEFDREKNRISLGYKTEEMNSWYIFSQKCKVGDVVSVKIVSMMPFGAFAEVVPGTDGLIHISQIAQTRISKPADVLEIGQVVDAKIIDIDNEKQNISLSIRALLDDADAQVQTSEDSTAE